MFEDTNVLTDQLADCLKEPQKPLFEMKAIAIVVAGLLLINIAVSPWILRFRSEANIFFLNIACMVIFPSRLHRCWWQVDVGDFVLVTILDVSDRISILVTSFGCWCPALMLKDRGCSWQNHLKIVANKFRLQHLSPTSVTNIDVAVRVGHCPTVIEAPKTVYLCS